MRISFSRTGRHSGSVLAIMLVVTALIGVALVAYLGMIGADQRAIARSEAWNTSIVKTEAGVDEALAHLNHNFPSNAVSQGWTLSGSDVTRKRTLDDGFYDVKISTATNPVIEARGYIRLVPTDAYISRAVRVQTVRTGAVDKAIFVEDGVNFNGNTIRTDSYDSTDPQHNTTGRYDSTKAKDGGDIATSSSDPGALDVGNSNIHGKVSTGPDSTPKVGANGAVGSETWHDAGNTGIEPGWSSDDCKAELESVEAPFSIGFIPLGGISGGVLYNAILYSGDYRVSALGGKVLVVGDARVLVTDKVQFTGDDLIRIAPGATLALYVAAKDANISGNGVVNESGIATAFSYYGLPSNESLSLGGNSSFAGLIYAPDAEVTLNGNTDVSGAIFCREATLNGTINFHYDEAFKNPGGLDRYVIASWQEL